MTEQAVMVHLPLDGSRLGSKGKRSAIFSLEQELEKVLAHSNDGELDGNEFGGGEVVLYLYGPDAERLFSSIESVLRRFGQGYAMLGFGAARNSEKSRRVDF